MPPSRVDPCTHALERSRRARIKGSCLVWEMRFVRREKTPKACWFVRDVDGEDLMGWEDVYACRVALSFDFGGSSDSANRRSRLEFAAGRGAFEGVGSMHVMHWRYSGLSSGLLFVSTGTRHSSNSSGELKAWACRARSISASSSSF